jgi:hypothetical protein
MPHLGVEYAHKNVPYYYNIIVNNEPKNNLISAL